MPTASWCSTADASSRPARSTSSSLPAAASPSWHGRSSWCRLRKCRRRRSTLRRKAETSRHGLLWSFPRKREPMTTARHPIHRDHGSPAAPGPKNDPLFLTLALFALACLVLWWPWLSGAVTIPWDAKSQFLPPERFLAEALARGDSPFWTPNIFGGWPQIADPQSLIFSPLHFLLALFVASPSFRAIDGVSFAYLFAGGLFLILFFRDRGWHPAGALVAAVAFACAGAASARLQHTGQIIS